MYTELSTRLAVTTTKEVSQPITVAEANAALFDFTVYEYGSGRVNVWLQGSNDLQNWFDLDGTATYLEAEGYQKSTQIDVTTAYARLRYATASGTSILSTGINLIHS